MDQIVRFLEALPKAVQALLELFKLATTPPIRKWAIAAVAFGAVALIATARPWPASFSQAWNPSDEVVETAIAEQRRRFLEDGSAIHVNTNSKIKIRYSETERRVEVIRGEARFIVGKDPTRPFVVTTPQAVVRDLGTEFNVSIADRRTTVTVLEGLVRINSKESDALLDKLLKPFRANTFRWNDRADLKPGEQATVTEDGRILPVLDPPLARVKAWSEPENELVFQKDLLPVLVSEFNRYHAKQIYIVDPELMQCRITLTMKAYNRAGFVTFLEKFAGFVVRTHSNGSVYLYTGRAQVGSKDACRFETPR